MVLSEIKTLLIHVSLWLYSHAITDRPDWSAVVGTNKCIHMPTLSTKNLCKIHVPRNSLRANRVSSLTGRYQPLAVHRRTTSEFSVVLPKNSLEKKTLPCYKQGAQTLTSCLIGGCQKKCYSRKWESSSHVYPFPGLKQNKIETTNHMVRRKIPVWEQQNEKHWETRETQQLFLDCRHWCGDGFRNLLTPRTT